MSELRHIGKDTPRMAARDFVTGRAKFAQDIRLPRMLYAKVLRSPYPYARIINIDTSKALALPGVAAVLTYKNSPPWKMGMPMPHKPMLGQTLYYVGDAVALIAAETEDIAAEARDLIDVEYEVLKPVLSIEEALAPGAPQLYPEMPGNIAPAKPFADMHMAFNEIHVGNVEEGFAEADVVVENDSLLDNAQNPLPPEAPGIICEWEGQYLTVRGSMSSSGLCKMMNAPFMQIPISNMRVIPAYVGGSYGSKHFSSQGSIILYASALAKVTNRPVGLFYDREEHFTAQTSRMVSKGHYKIGLKKDGTVTAIQGDWTGESGAFQGEQYLILGVGLISQPVLAQSKNIDITAKAVLTNRMCSGAYRGYGYLENGIHICNALYKGLEKINLDPYAYFCHNRLKVGDEFFHAYMCSGFHRSAGPDPIDLLHAGAEEFGWYDKWKGFGVPTSVDGSKIRAVGMGFCGQSDLGENPAQENVQLNFDGGVVVYCAATDFGPGTRDVMRKVAAEELNVPLEMVQVTPSDSISVPYDWGSTGSRSTYAMGSSVLEAARNAKQILFEKAAKLFGCPPQALETKDGMVSIMGHPEATMPWIAAIGFNQCITGVGHFEGAYNVTTHQAQFIEIEVDKETGKVTVLEQICSTDVGKIVNPSALKGQLDGYFPGMDLALREETIWDRSGRVINGNMIDYKSRTWNEVPRKHKNIVLESAVNNEEHPVPFGAIGGGEPSLAPAIPAITLALYNATGVWFNQYPVTSKEILDALNKKEGV